MALPGFELIYTSVAQQIDSTDNALIVAVHWNLVSNGLKCCGVGEAWPQENADNRVGSESLPQGWNSDSTIYCLRYVDPTSNRTYLMKALAIDGSLILHLMRCFDEKTVSVSVRSRDYVNDDFRNAASTFTNMSDLNSLLTKDLYKNLLDSKQSSPDRKATSSSSSTSTSTSTQGANPSGRSPLRVDPPNQGVPPGGIGFTPPRQPFRPSFQDPFSVGRADLDPLAGGQGGGMFMDPRNFPRPGGFGPGGPFGGGPPGFPPGSIPPGARFDPVGPPGVRPQPDPDHERPPDGYDDMFM